MTIQYDKNAKRKYSFSDYDPNWVTQFGVIKEFLSDIFTDPTVRIEHVGSTSVPGMKAKPLIDVLVIVKQMKDFTLEKDMMTKAGYECVENYVAPNTLCFFKAAADGEKIENIHVADSGIGFIPVRDYLRTHPKAAQEYSSIKEKNSILHPGDYPAYRAAKGAFLDILRKRAYVWYFKKHLCWYIHIQADKLLYWYSKITGTKGNAQALALYPFLITTSTMNPKMCPYFINHELIHFAQQKEMLIIGFYLLHVYEWIWLRIFKQISAHDTYVIRSTEQEAYDNMFDVEYLKKRKSYTHLKKYWKYKPIVWEEYLKNLKERS